MKKSQTFDNSPTSIRQARQFARDALQGSPAQVLDTVTLMVSELATNCVRHATGPFDLHVIKGPGEIRIEATDQGTGRPRVRSPAPTDPNGRGLQIVEMLSTSWGCNPAPGSGKTVWFTVTDQ